LKIIFVRLSSGSTSQDLVPFSSARIEEVATNNGTVRINVVVTGRAKIDIAIVRAEPTRVGLSVRITAHEYGITK
jgi:hypothetical protein